jgi:hypothetical protein
MSRVASQEKQVLALLSRGGEITPLDALNQFRCFRLAAVIHTLRRKGHDIETLDEHHDGGVHARYRLRTQPPKTVGGARALPVT